MNRGSRTAEAPRSPWRVSQAPSSYPRAQIAATLLDGGVVAEEDIKKLSSGGQIAATTVDNVMKLRKAVSLKHLREFGCIDGSNLVTSRVITSDQLQQIMTEGQGTRE
jgi:hypothetical protein